MNERNKVRDVTASAVSLWTPQYKHLNEHMHLISPEYGTSGKRYAQKIQVAYLMFGCTSLLDYGCGKTTLANSLPQFKITNYDPCIPRWSARPGPHDLVACTDVMEHIEPEFIDGVLDDIRSLAKKVAFFSISTRLAAKTLPDGRNTHISIHPYTWWFEKLASRWRVGTMHNAGNGDVEFTCFTQDVETVILPDEVLSV